MPDAPTGTKSCTCEYIPSAPAGVASKEILLFLSVTGTFPFIPTVVLRYGSALPGRRSRSRSRFSLLPYCYAGE